MYMACELRRCDVANGPGCRVTLFVSGCRNNCPGCFNKEAQNFHYGVPFTEEKLDELIEALKPSHIDGLTILGGEPMDETNQWTVLAIVQKVREVFGWSKTIWIFTGYVLDKDLIQSGRAHTVCTHEILDQIDVLVDGPFIQELKDISLQFRGSSNQRIIHLRQNSKTE